MENKEVNNLQQRIVVLTFRLVFTEAKKLKWTITDANLNVSLI